MRLGTSRLIQTPHKSDCSVFPAARVTGGIDRDRNRPNELLGRHPALAGTSHDVDQHYHHARGILRDAEHDTTIRRMPELGRWTVEEIIRRAGLSCQRWQSSVLFPRLLPLPFMVCAVVSEPRASLQATSTAYSAGSRTPCTCRGGEMFMCF